MEPMKLGPYTAFHWGAVVVTAVACFVVVFRASRRSKPRDDSALFWSLRIFALITVVPHHFIKVLYMERMLLDLCDLAGIVSVIHLFKPSRFTAGLLLYWGLTLTPNALLTPDFPTNAGPVRFFLFFGPHMAVVTTAVFATFGEKPVITWNMYRTCLAFSVCLILITIGYNHAFGANYMYLLEKPGPGSLLDLLGPWPWYVLVETLLAAAIWALLTIPFLPHTRRN